MAVLGLPGSGKGTQAAALAACYQLPHVEAGELLRQAVQAGTPLGREAAPYLQRGLLVPSPLTIPLVFQHLDTLPRFVLDGFPRTLVEAQELERFLKGRPLSLVLLLVQRLEEQRRPLEAVATFYRQRGLLVSIDASDPVAVVRERVLQAVEERALVK